MRVRRQANSHFDRLATNLVQRVGKPLQLVFARTTGRASAHVTFPEIAADRLKEVSGECHVVGDRLRRLFRVDEVCRLPLSPVRNIDQRHARLVELLLECHWVGTVVFYLLRVRLNPLQAEGGNPLDPPLDRVTGVPQGAGRAVQDVRVFGIEGRVIMRCRGHGALPSACYAVVMGARSTGRRRSGGDATTSPLNRTGSRSLVALARCSLGYRMDKGRFRRCRSVLICCHQESSALSWQM